MAKSKEKIYNDQSISSLKGADRVRKRPAVIFGSDGLEGCQHSFFEILSGPRTNKASPGSAVDFWINQNILSFVKAN